MKKLCLCLLLVFVVGCASTTSHYNAVRKYYAKEGTDFSKYKKIFLRNVSKTDGVESQAPAYIKSQIGFHIRDTGFSLVSENPDAAMEIHILRYKSSREWSPGTSATYWPGYYDKKGRYVPGTTWEGTPGKYYDSGEVELHLQVFDSRTSALIWEGVASGTGVPSAITDALLDDLVQCMKVSMDRGDCQNLRQKK